MDRKLYLALQSLRTRLKEEGKIKTGRAPLVCNDDALEYIARMLPKKMTDLESVPGVGRTFIENYGQLFLDVVNAYTQTENEKTVDMSNTAMDTLRELEKKLVSINRRNRLLYMPKIASKYAYDVVQKTPEDMLSVIWGQSQSCELCNLSNLDVIESTRYKSAVALIREINRDLRDRGQNDLYLAYPFVIGRIPGENFDIRCPLALFPVVADRTSTKITISLDDSRDVVYNSTLLLAYYKFNNITEPLPDVVLDEIDSESFIENLLSFYDEHGVRIEVKDDQIKKFKEYKSGEFPEFNVGELYLEKNIVLGKFPICSSSIQKDFEQMITEGLINNLLNELLLDVNDWDYNSDAFYGDVEKKDDERDFQVSEKNLVYINDLDSSQENVLMAIDELDKLVIQGPPGTGKSQVITSLIAKFINDNKTVLMVSEKKTALDVVYSRLGRLSKYALLIDDIGNKELFYRQLEKMVPLGINVQNNIVATDEIAGKIDERINQLEIVASKLYEIDDFGIEPYKLFLQSKKYDLNDPKEKKLYSAIYNWYSSNFIDVKYAELVEIKKCFSKKDLCDLLIKYQLIVDEYLWLADSKRGLNQLELVDVESKYLEFKNEFDVYTQQNFIKKFLSKGKIKKMAKCISDMFIDKNDKSFIRLLMKTPELFEMGFQKYQIYEDGLLLYESLSSHEKEYLRELTEICSSYENSKIANDDLYNVILYFRILYFERDNKHVLASIEQYKNVIHEISELIAKKTQITRERLEIILAQCMGNVSFAKRSGEIKRVIEGKRKWSVNRFINKFSFEIFNGIKVWLLTPEVVSEIIPLETGIFDLVIFDEASQMYIEKGLPAIHRAKKVVVAGDHKQLRPSSLGSGRMGFDEEDVSIDGEVTAALEEESLLDIARFKYQDVMLNYHYRSRYEELIAFSNYAFYKGKLHVSPNVDKPSKPPIEYHQMSNAIWSNRSNIVEAKFIVAMLKDIFNSRQNNETIGIITFNTSQRDLIMDIIDEQCELDVTFATQVRNEMVRVKDGEDIGLFIKNIESVQGDERDIIIFSIGYAKNENGRLIRNFGWLNQKGGENRLNVAISRAKQKVHIVASFNPEELQVEDTKNDGPRILKKYLQYSKAISDGDEQGAQSILHSFGDDDNCEENISFDSDFEMQVYDALNNRLADKGYVIDTQVGIGGYSIDLAIKKDGKYILGIECDGRTYHSSKSARERDYHRQKYLESRGWKIHRIWSTNWWNNPTREIERICKVLEFYTAV